MHKQVDQLAPWLLTGIVVVVVASAGYYVWNQFNPSQSVSADDAASIAKYKEWIKTNDLPLVGGKIRPADLPLVYRKVIEFDVKTGDLKSARSFISQTFQRKLDGQVMDMIQMPEAKELLRRMQNAQRKIDLLKQFVAETEKRSTQPEAEKGADTERTRLADEFCQIPFDATACPEAAEEIAQIYQNKLVPLKDKDQVIKQVAQEIETKCRPPLPASS